MCVLPLGRWRKVNSSPVCFGARNHQFGRFSMPSSGRLAAIKLVHLYGYVSCSKHGDANHWSYWGCGYSFSLTRDKVNVVVTTSSNHIILPPNQFLTRSGLGSGNGTRFLDTIRGPQSLSSQFSPILSGFLQDNSTRVVRRRFGRFPRNR